jgi:glutathione S-transferase
MIGQTANILQFLGPRLGLAPKDQASRIWAHQMQLTVTDWVAEVSLVHHPIANALYYEEQKDEAKKRASYFTSLRIPKFLGYYEKILQKNPKSTVFLFGKKICYVDLSLFQMVEGLRYAFPKTMAKLEPTIRASSRSMTKSRPAAAEKISRIAAPLGVQYQRHLSSLSGARRIIFQPSSHAAARVMM